MKIISDLLETLAGCDHPVRRVVIGLHWVAVESRYVGLAHTFRPPGKYEVADSGALVGILLAREALGTTAVGDGVAVPHGKVPGLAAPALVVGRSPDGVDFEALDGEPCRIFFLILAPEGGAGVHLKLLSQIARRAKDPDFRAELLAAPDASRMLQIVTAP